MCGYGSLFTEIASHDKHKLAFLRDSWECLKFSQVLHVAVVVVVAFGIVVVRVRFRSVWLALALTAAETGNRGSRVALPKQAYTACLSQEVSSKTSDDCRAYRYSSGGWWAAVLDIGHDKRGRCSAADTDEWAATDCDAVSSCLV